MALNFCPLSRKVPSQAAEHEMIPQAQLLHPPNPQRLCGFSHICTWTQDLFIYIYHLQGELASHVLWIGSHLHCPHKPLPIHTDKTWPGSHPAPKQQESLSEHTDSSRGWRETPHSEMWQEKRDQLNSTSSERCNNIDHITKFLNTRAQKYALTVIWAFHPFGFRSHNFVSSI